MPKTKKFLKIALGASLVILIGNTMPLVSSGTFVFLLALQLFIGVLTILETLR
jgi:hypothetical protein